MQKSSGKLSRSCGGFRSFGCRTIRVGFPDALRYALATHCHHFSRGLARIDRNPDKALIFWTNRIRIPRLDMIADLAGIREAARCLSLSTEGRTGCRLNLSGWSKSFSHFCTGTG